MSSILFQLGFFILSPLMFDKVICDYQVWNTKYSDAGISYTSEDVSIWSYFYDYYYISVSSISERCSGCSCDEKNETVQCTGTTVNVESFTFHNVTIGTFSNNTKSILHILSYGKDYRDNSKDLLPKSEVCTTKILVLPSELQVVTALKKLIDTKDSIIRGCPSFTLIDNGTFIFLTELTRLDIWRTSITVVPDLSTTKVETVMLVDNQIKLTTDNYRGWKFPDTIQHISLAGNLIHWIPPGWISGPNLRTVSFANNRLFSLFPNMYGAELNSLVYIGFEFNLIKQISRKGLEGLSTATSFKHLNLSNNAINYIEIDAFKQLTELRILELHNNSISVIQQNVFWDLENLLHLDLNKNSLTTVKSRTFMRMPNLRELRLHSQKTAMTSISYLAWRNISSNLRYLRRGIYSSSASKIPANLNPYVSDNALTTVPHQVLNEEEYPELIELHVDHNLIPNVSTYGREAFNDLKDPDYRARVLAFIPFKTMQNLLKLFLHNNLLTEVVGPEYCSLKSLITLDISYNIFDDNSINVTAFHCIPTLEQLEMAGNSIQHVPVAVNPRDLPNLETFNMDQNDVGTLEEGVFAIFKNLSNLYFRNNKIVAVENGSFPSSLRTLWMSNNDFRFLHTGPFWNLYNLASLDLSSNSIGVIPDQAFFNCTSLKWIDLSDNRIPVIKRIHFADCPLTSFIDLQNNIIGIIEDSTFDHVTAHPDLYLSGNMMNHLPKNTFNRTSMDYVYLSSNRLEFLQSGVFQDFQAYRLDLQSNRIAVIESEAFLRVSFTYLYLSNNNIHTIESNAFRVLTCHEFYMSNNNIEQIQSYAFSNVTVTEEFDLTRTYTSDLPSYAFYNVSVHNIDLRDGLFQYLDEYAFSNFRCTNSFNMASNRIESITQPIFDEHSHLEGSFSMHNNSIRYMADNALGWNHSLEYLYLYSNELFSYPQALASLQAQKIYLDNNNIEEIPDGVFLNSSELKILSMTGNRLEHLPQFPTDLVQIERIDLSNNNIETISQSAFTNIKTTVRDVNLDGNPLNCQCDVVYSLDEISQHVTGGACVYPSYAAGIQFAFSSKDSSLYYLTVNSSLIRCAPSNIYGNTSASDVYLEWSIPNSVHAVFSVSNTTSSTTIRQDISDSKTLCVGKSHYDNATLTQITDILFYANDTQVFCEDDGSNTNSSLDCVNGTACSLTPDTEDTLCVSSELISSDSLSNLAALLTNELSNTVDPGDLPYYTCDWCNVNCRCSQFNNNLMNPHVSFFITCVSSTAGTLYRTLDDECGYADHYSVTLNETDGVLAGTQYECSITLTTENMTSGKSSPVYLETAAAFAEETNLNDTDDIVVPITYYDFGYHVDFDDTATISWTPLYTSSLYSSWLETSDDEQHDTFSSWFRGVPGTNIVFETTMVLTKVDSNQSTYRYRFYSDNFFPVDGIGYADIVQEDCNGTQHNFGFTSAIRTAFRFTGNETVIIGGGEAIWVFINKQIVTEIITDANTNLKLCHKIGLQNTSGSGVVVIEVGEIVGQECMNYTEETSTNVTIDIELGEVCRLEIFHAETRTCTSWYYLETSNVEFVPENETKISLAEDLIMFVNENSTLNSVVETVNFTDAYSIGPYVVVTIKTGNQQMHFTLKNDTTENREAGNQTVPSTDVVTNRTTTDGHVLSFIECTGNLSETPTYNSSNEDVFIITSASALLTVANYLNRETVDKYNLVLEVFDPGLNLTGHITIMILVNDSNDNCPITNSTGGTLYAIPALQTDPLAVIYVTDLDLDENACLSFYISELQFEPSRDYNQSLDLQEHVLTNSSSLTFDVLILDNGIPPRGTMITYNMTLSNTCIIDDRYGNVIQQFIVGNGTSDLYPLYLRIPKYYNYEFECSDRVGIEYGYVMDGQFSASSVLNEYTGPERARLNLQKNLITNHVGGWVADTQDQFPWLQVDMLNPFKFTALLLQGREDLPSWVTSYRIYYADAISDNFTLYTDANGENTFVGNMDQSTVVTKDLDPPILAQYIRVYPKTWNNMNSTSGGNISLRLDFNGCTLAEQHYYDTSCLRCETSYFCEGDGKRHSCGRCENESISNSTDTCNRHPTEHSFGLADSCTSCPDGWICHNGTAYACEKFHYSTCNESWCPETCTPCEPGYACHSGIRSICPPGTYSNGSVELCQGCKAGTFQASYAQDSCIPCPPGYHSNQRHDRCERCEETTYSDGTGNACIACSSNMECPCMGHDVCFNGTDCINTGNGGYTCGDCPTGYLGDGTTCVDVDECTFYQPYVPCWNESACVNTEPGYQCLECPEGYTSTYEDALAYNNTQRVFLYMNLERAPLTYQTCEDFDECSINNGGCDPNMQCYNTIGSYYCGICAEGYIGNQTYGCHEADFCASGRHTCSMNATCIYFGPGIFKCECKVGYAGNGHICSLDTDNDGHPDEHLSCTEWGCLKDNCLTVPNNVQEDTDRDKMGDACDTDDDYDYVTDNLDNCQYVSNFDQQDQDADGVGDACDNCDSTVNSDQTDTDNDGIGDVCDNDDDNDGLDDISDNCPNVNNVGQEDSDSDGVGDACDNCRDDANSIQVDADMNSYGDICDPLHNKDKDGDGVLDMSDNCLLRSNADQSDIDLDGQGDICDEDVDGDNVPNEDDNCPYTANPLQQDLDGDRVGDICYGDSDLDGTPDINDTCINNPNINVTSFKKYFVVNLDPTLTGANEPVWHVHGNGAEITQVEDSHVPSMLIGEQGYSDMKYQGTWYVGNLDTTAYIGFVFGYISNRNFYTVLFKGPSPNYEYDISDPAVKGIQLKVVDSNNGPSHSLSNALWHSVSTSDEATMLWHDPNMTSWQPRIAYRWILYFRPSIGQMRIQVYQGTSMIVDSGQIQDGTITGGRVGVIQYGRFSSIWSNLNVECLMETNKALTFNGLSDYIELTTFPNLVDVNEHQQYKLGKSFTFEIWIKMDSENLSDIHPLFCTDESYYVCLWIKGAIVYGAFGTTQIQGSQVLTLGQWHNVIFRYSQEYMTCALFVNGTLDAESNNTEDIDFSTVNPSSMVMYIGRIGDAYFRGDIDEVRLYNIAIDDNEILEHISSVGLVTAKHQGYVQLHFTMQDENGSGMLVNEGTLITLVVAHGNQSFVSSNQQSAQFTVANPNN